MANGEETLFWSGHWVGGDILKNRLDQLFFISSNKEAKMVDFRRGASRSRTCDWDSGGEESYSSGKQNFYNLF